MAQVTTHVLQFLNTYADHKDYYEVELRDKLFVLSHKIPSDNGIYIEDDVQVSTTDDNLYHFLDAAIPISKHKIHVYLSSDLKLEGRYTRFQFYERKGPVSESNKFVGVFIYAHGEDVDSPQQLLIIFKKRTNSLISYEIFGQYDPSVDVTYQCVIEEIRKNNQNFKIYYYGDHIPRSVDKFLLQYMHTMPYCLQVTNRETCPNHDEYLRSCISCVGSDILSSPRQLSTVNRTKKNGRKRFIRQRNCEPKRRQLWY